MNHLISITGAGPGDPELLTLKAHQRISTAEVVIYDALPGDAILKLAPANATFLYAGKLANDGQDQSFRQAAIHQLLLQMARKGKRIVRLKGGDPMIFGRGAEEIRFCQKNNLNYEVIPGVSAALAAAAEYEIPLTERHKSCMVLFCAGSRARGCMDQIDTVLSVLRSGSTVSIYMGLSKLESMSESLLSAGLAPHTPVNILSNVSQAGSSCVTGRLDQIAGIAGKVRPASPAMIIIGEHAERITLTAGCYNAGTVTADKLRAKPPAQVQNIFSNIL
ncbi:MAG: uroporphyrinogen-III C-methyltransferase [Prolixibacteraceae bacterium]|nr:uroporphyrinogen-III C-methyltransferase [Prolixibacteraceae bacterium]